MTRDEQEARQIASEIRSAIDDALRARIDLVPDEHRDRIEARRARGR